MINNLSELELWFITGSQHLYGEETLRQVDQNSREIADALSRSSSIPVKVIFKSVLTTPEEILALCQEANNAPGCIGLIAWMHTFSPAKMWIAGLNPFPNLFCTCIPSSTGIFPGSPLIWTI